MCYTGSLNSAYYSCLVPPCNDRFKFSASSTALTQVLLVLLNRSRHQADCKADRQPSLPYPCPLKPLGYMCNASYIWRANDVQSLQTSYRAAHKTHYTILQHLTRCCDPSSVPCYRWPGSVTSQCSLLCLFFSPDCPFTACQPAQVIIPSRRAAVTCVASVNNKIT